MDSIQNPDGQYPWPDPPAHAMANDLLVPARQLLGTNRLEERAGDGEPAWIEPGRRRRAD